MERVKKKGAGSAAWPGHARAFFRKFKIRKSPGALQMHWRRSQGIPPRTSNRNRYEWFRRSVGHLIEKAVRYEAAERALREAVTRISVLERTIKRMEQIWSSAELSARKAQAQARGAKTRAAGAMVEHSKD